MLRGFVQTTDGKPVARARVSFVAAELPDLAALTADDGSFAVSAKVPGEYELSATSDEHGVGHAVVHTGPNGVTGVIIRLN